MFRILIHGIKDGEYKLNLSADASQIGFLPEEFFGTVTFTGLMRKITKKISITGTAGCTASLVCDRTLTDYNEEISASVSVSYLTDSFLFLNRSSNDSSDSELIIIHEDEKEIDLTEEITQQLSVSLPMKRLAPDVREIDINDLFPEIEIISSEATIGDDRWSKLKNVVIN
ncbi:MAG: DUF177 domain-containing protein [Candidatus Kapabacteria bacterium]|nr:DUF177 domain-containing protein [Candidatus Kapabacteria bacterium]